ncbi:MAG TPA: ThuA domain-containing protein [Chthoniobacteraceae bacterium]|nr:ThuA domain-containing protein [Chthoniobacteraceae bacterium]
MKRPSRFSLSAALTFALAMAALLRMAEAAGPMRKILFFTKSSGFEHDVISYKQGQPSFAEKAMSELAAKHNWTIEFSKDGSLFSPEYLGQFDALFFYTTGDLTSPGTDKQPPMTSAGKQALLDYVASGKGFIGSHSASDTFHTLNEAKKGPDRYRNFGAAADPYVRMLGGEFIKHGAQQKARMRCADPKFPGLEKYAAGFDLHEEWYSLKDFSEDLHVILVQETDAMKGIEYQRPAFPATWARMHGKGRVFYTSMGHREDVWINPIFQDVLVGGIGWALGDVKADVTPNLSTVAPGWNTNPPFPPPAAPKPESAAATPATP